MVGLPVDLRQSIEVILSLPTGSVKAVTRRVSTPLLSIRYWAWPLTPSIPPVPAPSNMSVNRRSPPVLEALIFRVNEVLRAASWLTVPTGPSQALTAAAEPAEAPVVLASSVTLPDPSTVNVSVTVPRLVAAVFSRPVLLNDTFTSPLSGVAAMAMAAVQPKIQRDSCERMGLETRGVFMRADERVGGMGRQDAMIGKARKAGFFDQGSRTGNGHWLRVLASRPIV